MREYVTIDSNTQRHTRFDTMRTLINIMSIKSIIENFLVNFQGFNFTIIVNEEYYPKFFSWIPPSTPYESSTFNDDSDHNSHDTIKNAADPIDATNSITVPNSGGVNFLSLNL